jgi:hypothetical protein
MLLLPLVWVFKMYYYYIGSWFSYGDHGVRQIMGLSPGQTKDYISGTCYLSANYAACWNENKNWLIWTMIMCRGGANCIPANCYCAKSPQLSWLVQYKADIIIVGSHWSITCSHHDITEKLLLTTLTHSFIRVTTISTNTCIVSTVQEMCDTWNRRSKVYRSICSCVIFLWKFGWLLYLFSLYVGLYWCNIYI